MMNGVKQAIVCMTLAVQTLYALPSFVTDPPYDEQYYYEFGEADGSNASQAFKRAEERAWEKIKEQIELKIESMQIDYEAHTGK
ncbi:MAG: hypothetical protein LBB43_03530, partial [Spirochaetaceae bacterium]|nr:hypothetical protein [Spirochaetaceae bacterium]